MRWAINDITTIKNCGLIQQPFKGLGIDETRLMKINFTVPFELMKDNFIYLVSEQQNHYTSQDFQET